MSRTRNATITAIASALVIAAVVAPSAGASERTATELGQSTGPPSTATPSGGDPSERTATELGQAVGEPGDGAGKFARTPTELSQSTNLSASPTPSSESNGFDWGAVAIVAGSVLGLVLIGVGGIVLLSRRRGGVRKPRTPVVSS